MGQDCIAYLREGAVATITLNRPEAFNALDLEMVDELASALAKATDQDVRAVVITGSGGSFCAGADVKEFHQARERSGSEGVSSHLRGIATRMHNDVMLKIRRLPKPVIGSINGVAAGGGFSLALACDLRIASEEARLVMAFARIGATADGGSTYLLPRIVGQARAMEIYLTNQVLTAQRALEMGLVNEVVPATELAQRTAELAQRLASGPTAAFARTKALMEAGWTSDLASQMKGEAEALADMGHTDDFREGVSAFVNKGTPQFQGQ